VIDMQRNILQIAGLYDPAVSIDEAFSQIESKLVDLRTGNYVTDMDVESYEQRSAAADPKSNIVLSKEQDIAGIKRQAKIAKVYLISDEQGLQKVILPIHGYGLWSTLYGFLALEGDLNTVIGMGFYEHAETPGLGGEVDNPRWRASWTGKKLFDAEGEIKIDVVKGGVSQNPDVGQYQIDALAGATLTSRGVKNLVDFWVGDLGFGPYLAKLEEQRG